MSFYKWSLRKTHLYPFLMGTSVGLRSLLQIFMVKYLGFIQSCFYTVFGFSAEVIGGLILVKYIQSYFKNVKTKSKDSLNKNFLIYNKQKMNRKISGLCVLCLLSLCGFLDFIAFAFWEIYLERVFPNIPSTFELRIRGLLIITQAVLLHIFLKSKIYKHNYLSLIIILICLVITMILEIIYTKNKQILSVLLIFVLYAIQSIQDIIEKYLFEYNYVDILYILIGEGVSGDISVLIGYFFMKIINGDDIINLPKFSENEKTKNTIIMAICLIIYLVLSLGRNLYRLMTIYLFSPTSRALFDRFYDPLFIIYYFFIKNKTEYNFPYYMFNLINVFVIFLCSIIYNEILILKFCNLNSNTKLKITERGNEETLDILTVNFDDVEMINETNLNYETRLN